jgi:chromosomal replication initiator protein
VIARCTIADIMQAASECTAVTVDELVSYRRFAYISRVRQGCFTLAREQGYSYPQIASRFGGRDHSTVIHGVKECAGRMERSLIYAQTVNAIRWRARWLSEQRKIKITAAAAPYGVSFAA